MTPAFQDFDFNKFQAWIHQLLLENEREQKAITERDIDRMERELSVYTSSPEHQACKRIMNPNNYN